MRGIARSKEAPGDPRLAVALGVLGLLVVNLVLAWVAEYYLGHPVIGALSFRAHDPSWLPPGVSLPPAIGVHYFGDFEQYMGYALSRIPPYSPRIGLPPAYGPAAIVLAKVLHGLFGWPGAALVFVAGSLTAFAASLVLLLGRSLSSLLLAGLVSTSGAAVMALDRGNYELVVAALCVLCCVALLRDRPVVAVLALSAAMSLKGYTAVLLLAFVVFRRVRSALWACVCTLAVYLAGFLVLGGGLWTSIVDFVHTDLLFASSPTKGFMLGCVSATAAVYKTLWLFWTSGHFFAFLAHSPSWYVQVPGLLAAGLCAAVLVLGRHRRELVLVACFALMQLVPDGAYPYTQISCTIELVLLVRLLVAGTDEVRRGIVIAAVGLLALGAAPWATTITGPSGNTTPLYAFLGPWANLAALATVLGGLVRARRGAHASASPLVDPNAPVAAATRERRVAPAP